MTDGDKSQLNYSKLFSKIEGSILSFCNITKLPVTFYNKDGFIQNEYNSQMKICKFLDVYNTEGSICKKNLKSSMNTASTLGEPYIFVCSAGFIKIAITLMVNGEILGCFMVGPLVMEKLRRRTIEKIIQLNSNLTSTSDNSFPLSRIFLLLNELRIFSPKEVSDLANLLSDCIISNLSDTSDYANIKLKYKEQSQVGVALQNSKKTNKSFSYPLELESKLIRSVKTGDSILAESILSEIFQSVLLLGAGNIDFIKISLIEITTLLSRSAIDDGLSPEDAINRNFDFINALNSIDTIQGLESWSKELIGFFTENVSITLYSGKSQIIKDILTDINLDVSSKLSLSMLAKKHHINSSYLSVCFKKEMGISFTDYLNKIRIKKSKELLEKTNLRIIDISVNSGFEDQSYFTKVFRLEEGCTPSEYRKRFSLTSVV